MGRFNRQEGGEPYPDRIIAAESAERRLSLIHIVSYRLKQLQEEIKLPIAEVPSLDYAIGNAENVMKLAHQLCDK